MISPSRLTGSILPGEYRHLTLKQGVKLIDLLVLTAHRPEVMARESLLRTLESIQERKEEIIESADIRIKYSGYIKREQVMADKITRLEEIRIKDKFNYNEIQSFQPKQDRN